MKYLIFWAILFSTTAGAQTLPADSLAADWRQLVGYVEQTHPDPYTAFGGRVFFGLAAQKTGEDIVRGALTVEDFARHAAVFLATLHDGHTFINGVPRGVDAQTMRYPIHARVTGHGLIVTRIPAEHKELIGARIVSVAGATIERIVERVATMQAVENDFGALNAVGQRLFLLRALGWLTPIDGTTVEMTFELPNGERRTQTFDYLPPAEYEALKTDLAAAPVWSGCEIEGTMGWRELDGRTMYFRLARVQDGERLHKTFGEMLRRMRDENMPHLIIDLRGNGGGMTPIVHQTLYQLYGERFLATDMGIINYRRMSPLYERKAGRELDGEYGDYVLGRWTTPRVDRSEGQIYEPKKVFVVTDAGTFSAAFHYAFFLWKMGATIVGTPSGQAPNSFMETTPFELSRTGLRGSISNSMQRFLPDDDRRAKVFWPEVMLSAGQLAEYGFDENSEILYLCDILSGRRNTP